MQQGTGAAAADQVVAIEMMPNLTLAMINNVVAKTKATNRIDIEDYYDLPDPSESRHPVYQALAAMEKAGHWRAKEVLKLRDYKLIKFCHRVMKSNQRTPFLDEVRRQVVKMRLKGEL